MCGSICTGAIDRIVSADAVHLKSRAAACAAASTAACAASRCWSALDRISTIVTDARADAEHVAAIREAGVEVLVAEADEQAAAAGTA